MTVERIEEARLRVEIATRVSKFRQRRQLTQEQLAQRAEISRSFVSDLESGTVAGNALVYVRLARALDCSVHLLLTGDEAPPTSAILEQLAQLSRRLDQFEENVTRELRKVGAGL